MMRPNFLWIVSEDCPPRFGCYGDDVASTPHLDAFAARSVLFEHAYSPAPVCAPSRFALLTGVPPEAHAPANHMRAAAALPDWMTTYPEILGSLGYYRTNNAKTDYNAEVDPAELWDDCSTLAHWRGRDGTQPFLAVFNIDGTHEMAVFRPDPPKVDPASVRVPAYLPDTPEIRADIARYYEDIELMDHRFGDLLAQLEEDGLTESTVVFQTSDHGGVNPRSKRHCYEEGLHVPLMIHAPPRWKNRFPRPGTRLSGAVSTASIPVTLVDLAGGEVPSHMEAPSLATPTPATDTLAYGARNRMDERYDFVRTVTDGRHRYLRNFLPHRPSGQHQAFAWAARGYQSWEAAHLEGTLTAEQDSFWRPRPPVELYDLVNDPDQVVNLAGRPTSAVVEARLAAALREHMLHVHDNGFLPEGAAVEGWDASRTPGAYDLRRLLELSDLVAAPQDVGCDRMATLCDLLDDPDPLIRRWSATFLISADPLGDEEGRRIAVGLLATRLLIECEPSVMVAVAEALAVLGGTARDAVDRGVEALVRLTGVEHSFGVRLEAVNALTQLSPASLRDRVGTVVAGADDGEYMRQAIQYLTLHAEGRYAPDVPIGPWRDLFAAPRGW